MTHKRLLFQRVRAKIERPETALARCPGLTETKPDKEATMTADCREYTCSRDSAPVRNAALEVRA